MSTNRRETTALVGYLLRSSPRGAADDPSQEMVEWYKTYSTRRFCTRTISCLYDLRRGASSYRIGRRPGLVEKPKRSAGLDHLAFFYSNFGEWITTYERLKAAGITPRVQIHHGLSMSLYYRDPDDNGVELSIDNVEKSQWHDWMRNRLGENRWECPSTLTSWRVNTMAEWQSQSSGVSNRLGDSTRKYYAA